MPISINQFPCQNVKNLPVRGLQNTPTSAFITDFDRQHSDDQQLLPVLRQHNPEDTATFTVKQTL